jgi:hypothetical protein
MAGSASETKSDITKKEQQVLNAAVKLFLGNGTARERSHLDFNTWYDPFICQYLLQMSDNKAQLIRVIFLDEEGGRNKQTFGDQLETLVVLGNSMRKNAIFISKEPGADNHFICGLIKENKLFIINPYGISDREGFYQILAGLQQRNKIGEVWLSNQVLQSSEDSVSCGPIAIELATHILSQMTESAVNEFWGSITGGKKELTIHRTTELNYYPIAITGLLPHTLVPLLDSNKHLYEQRMLSLRAKHLKQLEELSPVLARVAQIPISTYLEKIRNEALAQVVFSALVTKHKSILNISEMPEYSELVEELGEPRMFTGREEKVEGGNERPGDLASASGSGSPRRLSASLEAVAVGKDTLQKPEDFGEIGAKFRQNHTVKLKELQAAREEADRIDQLVRGDLRGIEGIQRQLTENKEKMDRALAEYKGSRPGVYMPLLAPIGRLLAPVGGWLPLGSIMGVFGYGSSERPSENDEVSIDSGSEPGDSRNSSMGSSPEVGGSLVRQPIVTQPVLTGEVGLEQSVQIDRQFKAALEECSIELRKIQEEEKHQKERILENREKLVKNIVEQNRLFKELAEIVCEFLEKKIDVDASEEKSKPSAVVTLHHLKQSIGQTQEKEPGKEASSDAGQGLELKRAQLRENKAVFLQLLEDVIRESSAGNRETSAEDAAVTEEAVRALRECLVMPVFASPQKSRKESAKTLDVEEQPMTVRSLQPAIAAYERNQPRQLVVVEVGNSEADDRVAELQRQVKKLAEQQELARREVEESAQVAAQSVQGAEKWKAVAIAAGERVDKLGKQNVALTDALREKTEQYRVLTHAFQSLRASVANTGVSTPALHQSGVLFPRIEAEHGKK